MLRTAYVILFVLFVLPAYVLADVTTSELVYDQRVCQAQGGAGDPVAAAVEAAQSADCQAMMAAFPKPEIERILADESTLRRSYWRLKKGATNLFDAPGGQVIGDIPAGFNFVQATDAKVEGLGSARRRRMDPQQRWQAGASVNLHRLCAARTLAASLCHHRGQGGSLRFTTPGCIWQQGKWLLRAEAQARQHLRAVGRPHGQGLVPGGTTAMDSARTSSDVRAGAATGGCSRPLGGGRSL